MRPWIPFYVGDYVRDTLHLSCVEHGAYLLLILHYWSHGDLPDDDQRLANIVHLPLVEWRFHRPILQAFFYDGWKHKRLDAELRRTTEKTAKARIAGAKGGAVAALNREKNRYQLQQLGSNRYSKR